MQRVYFLLLCVTVLMGSSTAWAHRVLLFAYVEGDTVHAEAGFPGGKPVHQGKMQVKAADTGEVLLDGVTDDEGRFSFPVPQAARDRGTDLLLVIDASMGHRTEWTIQAKEFLSGAPTAAATPAENAPAETVASPVAGTVDGQALADLVAQRVTAELDARLTPLQVQLGRMTEQGPSLSDILGGIGWILGLAGIYAWAASRRK